MCLCACTGWHPAAAAAQAALGAAGGILPGGAGDLCRACNCCYQVCAAHNTGWGCGVGCKRVGFGLLHDHQVSTPPECVLLCWSCTDPVQQSCCCCRGSAGNAPLPTTLVCVFMCVHVYCACSCTCCCCCRPLASLVDPASAPYLYYAMNQQQEIMVLAIGMGVGVAAGACLCLLCD